MKQIFKSRKWIFPLMSICAILISLGGMEVRRNSSPEKLVQESDAAGAIQIVMNELCEKEVAEHCPNTWGIDTYRCIKKIDSKFLSERCRSTFK